MASQQVAYSGPRPLQPLNGKMRHGFDEAYNSENFLSSLANNFYIYYDDKRHNANGSPMPEKMKKLPAYAKNFQPIVDWKIMKERQKTISAVLVLCLNLGVDPPDMVKTYPCAKYEAWCDPANYPDTKKAIEAIGKSLHGQYETLSLRTRYKQSLDPCVEDVKRFCNTLRRNAKDERILFHYNGHGVPQPTASGEIWVFNRGYTQYIPISLYDLQTWLGAPVIFVYDCNSAGNIVHNFKKFVQKRIDEDNVGNHDMSAPSPTSAYLDSIQLAACKSQEILPMSPGLPADLFTCCLTCPIDISLRWFVMQLPLKESYYLLLPTTATGNIVVPGKLTDRHTPLGELNWIFTAITDTIAWTSLSRPIFKRLFRQDLMVAALFRNFLLAKRIMPHFNCNPVSDPPLPESVRFHPMWDSWDLAIDQVFAQLIKSSNSDQYAYVVPSSPQGKPAEKGAGGTEKPEKSKDSTKPATLQVPEKAKKQEKPETSQKPETQPVSTAVQTQVLSNYQHSTFFEQQLTAFEIWLKYAGSSSKMPPEQLPIVLQVLLSQVHRLRALILLLKFLDMGPWAVYLSLSIGIFPYVLKLLQSPAQELKPVLIFIWARIMAIDYPSTQQELCKDKGYNYFYLILNSSPANPIGFPAAPCGMISAGSCTGNVVVNDDHKAMSAFILTLFIKDFKNGQRLCFSTELVTNCLKFVTHSENPLLRQWCCLLLSQLWLKSPDTKWLIYKEGHLGRFVELVSDPIPEVRTSIIIALMTFLTADPVEPSPKSRAPSEVSLSKAPAPASNDTLQKEANVKADLRSDELRLQDLRLANVVLRLLGDGSTVVRKEIVFFMARFVQAYERFFVVVAFAQLQEEIVLLDSPHDVQEFRKKSPAYGSVFSSVWKALLILSEDPHVEVQELAATLIDSVMYTLVQSELAPLVRQMQQYLMSKSSINVRDNVQAPPPFVDRTPLSMQRENRRRQVSSRSAAARKNELTMTGGLLRTRAPSCTDGGNPLLDDASFITSKLKNLGIAKLFKSFHISEDADLNNFTRTLSTGPAASHYGVEYLPKLPRYFLRDPVPALHLPAESGFFAYSCETFQEPQMSKSEVDEPGSAEYVRRLWRRNRNEHTIQETQPQKKVAIRGDWNGSVRVLSTKTQPKLVRFMQFEKLVVSTDEKDTLSVWDWEQSRVVHRFCNGNPFGTKITALKFLNEDDVPLVLTGSSDGVVKIYKDFHLDNAASNTDEENPVKLVVAWRALTDLLLTAKSSGVVCEWQQSRGSLLVSGDVKIIRVWDAPRELCVSDIPARSSSSITSLTSDQVAGDTFVAGFDDGSLRIYDRRLDSRESMVKVWQDGRGGAKNIGRGSIRNIHMQRGGFRELVSGSTDGYINLWDIRHAQPVSTFTGAEKSIRTIDVHEHAPIVTCGSKAVSILTTSGDVVATLKNPHETYLANRTSNYLSQIAFHPHRMMVATNYNQDGHINIYTCRDTFSEY